MSSYTTSYLSGGRSRRTRAIGRAGRYMLAILVTAFLMTFVWQRAQAIKLGYEVEGLKDERATLAKANELLRVEVAALASPERVEQIATRQLGMVVPSDSQMVLVKRVPKGAGPAPDGSQQARKPSGRPGRT